MFNHVHGHSHISGFLRNYMCKTIFLAGKHNACELCWTGKIATWPGQVVKPCSPSSLTFQNNNPKTRQNWLHKNSTIISTNTLIFHLCYWLRRIFWMFGCCRRVTAQSGERWYTLSQRWKASFHAQGLGIANVHFPMLKMNRNESQYGSPIVSRFFADWFTIRCVLIQIHAHVLMDHVYWDLGKLTVLFCKTFACITRMLDPTLGRLWWFLSLLSHFGGLFVGNVPISMTYSKRF